MADDPLVGQLAAVMHTACDGKDCDCHAAAREEFEVCAAAALSWLAERGRVGLAEVLDALRDDDALRAWYMARHPYACIDIGSAGFFAEYLAERFPTAPRSTEVEGPTFFERRAAKDPSVDHSSHSANWVGGCGECPGEAAPQAADERNDHAS